MLANGDTIDELLEDYPSLQREDIFAYLEYAAFLTEEEITPLELTEAAAWLPSSSTLKNNGTIVSL